MAVPTMTSRKNAWRAVAAAGLMAGLLSVSGCATVDSALGAVGLQRIPPARPAPAIKTETAVASWTGTYRGTLPCPDCEGVRIALTLYKDATYELQTEQMGADKRHSRKGSFTFNADETRVTMDANGQNRSFDILPPNALRMLGKDGKPVSGPDAERFILRK